MHPSGPPAPHRTATWRAVPPASFAAPLGILAAVTLVVLVVSACGRVAEPEPEGPPRLDAATARQIADESLLREDDLGGGAWRTIEDGPLAGDALAPDEFFAPPECEPLRRFLSEEHPAADGIEPLATAEQGFQSSEGALTVRLVTSSIAVYETVAEAEQAAQASADSLVAEALRPCLEEALPGTQVEGIEVRRVIPGPATASIEGSEGLALDVELSAIFFTFALRAHIYTIQREHALGSLVTIELNSDALERQQQTLLEAFAGRIERAHEGR